MRLKVLNKRRKGMVENVDSSLVGDVGRGNVLIHAFSRNVVVIKQTRVVIVV